MHTPVSKPNVKALKSFKCSFEPAYGIIIYPDKLKTEDDKTKLVINFEDKVQTSAGKYNAATGVIVAISESFRKDFVGNTELKIGDRVIVEANKTAILFDKDIKLLVVREPNILAVIPESADISI